MEYRIGRVIFALGIVALGIESLVLGIPVQRLEAYQKDWPYYAEAGRAVGAVFVLVGGALFVDRVAKAAAVLLALVLLGWDIGFHLIKLLPTVSVGDHWGGFAETLAVFAAAWVLAALLPPPDSRGWKRIAAWGVPYGRICFGVALIVFGAVHFIYLDFTAKFIPDWVPYRPFFAEFTGFAHIFAGLAILTGVLGRVGAILAGVMYASWVVMLHIPRALHATEQAPFEWNAVFVASILAAGAWLVAASFSRDSGRDAGQNPGRA
ncbi:MAG TPA: DoxX family membrane protein [Rhizomicrobium sp.]|jgi:uncharacterized membrane protein